MAVELQLLKDKYADIFFDHVDLPPHIGVF